MGTRDVPWQDTHAVLDRFGGSAGRARADYRHFVEQAGSEDEYFATKTGPSPP